jgi:hypothetical protein
LVIEIDFVDGDQTSDEAVQNYKKRLADTVQEAAQTLLLRTIKVTHVVSDHPRNQNARAWGCCQKREAFRLN